MTAGCAQVFIAAWSSLIWRLMKLYRNQRNPKMLTNKGRYETVESFMACVKISEFEKLSPVLTDLGVERVAGLYDVVQDFGGGGN